MSDWKALREQAEMTLADLAKRSGYSIGTINGLELHGEGSARLKNKLREVLTAASKIKETVTGADQESVTSVVDLREQPQEYLTVEECKQRIKQLEDDNARLRAMVFAAASPRFSSAPPLSEAQSIAKRKGDEHDAGPQK